MIETLRFSEESFWLKTLTEDFCRLVEDAMTMRGRVHIALSGGVTPRPFYLHLSRQTLPWDRIWWWLGDERWGLPTDAASNEKMVRETLGQGRPDFSSHFQSWYLAQDPTEAAKLYETRLRERVGDPPIFDLILLGIGPDGHVASLFPDTAVLKERTHDAVAYEVPQLRAIRLTLTFPVLDCARQIWFLVQGKEKEPVLNKWMAHVRDLPVAQVQAVHQKLYWLL